MRRRLILPLLLVPSLFVATVSACSAGRHTVDAAILGAGQSSLDRPIDFQRVDHDALSDAIVKTTNAVRAKHGLPELEHNRTLDEAGASHARRMVDKQFLSHDDPFDERRRTPADRVRRAGGSNPTPAENIADVPAFRIESGQPFYVLDADEPVIALEPEGPPVERHTYASYAASVVEGWMNSPGHRKNLLHPDALEIGVGAAMYRQNEVPTFIVVQVFQLFEPLK